MHRFARMLALGGSVALATAVVTACHGDGAGSCQSDTDCPTSYVCRDSVCGPTDPSSVTTPSPNDGGVGATCATENATCTFDDDCCSRTCSSNVCASSVTSGQPSCVGLSALCQGPDDCCTGLSCTKGVCQ